jgi:outer membrane protein
MPNLTRLAACLTLAAAGALPPAVHAQDSGSFLVRVRATHLDSVNRDSTGLGLSVNNKTYGTIDGSWFMSPNIAAELSVSSAHKHTLYSNGSTIGTLEQLPVSVMLQYHLTGLQGWRPYVGLGVHYTRFSSVGFEPAVVTALNPDIERSSTGMAVQMRTDVSSSGSTVGTLKVDPMLLSAGLGYRF